jgi:predicted  nucleic acid-binding Zn-ribbon protein
LSITFSYGLKYKIAEKDQIVERLNIEMANLSQHVSVKTSEIKKMADAIKDYNYKIEVLQDQNNDLRHEISQVDINYKAVQNKLNEKNEQVCSRWQRNHRNARFSLI